MATKIPKDLTADRFVRALIDRLVSTERKIASLDKELQDLREQVAESSAWLLPSGEIGFRNILEADSDELTTYEAVVAPVSVKVTGE